MENEVLSGLIELFARFGGRLVGSAVIVALGLYLAKKVVRLTRKATKRWDLDETGIRFVANIVYYILASVVLLIAVNNLGVEISAILGALGVAGLAVGLALTGAVTNLAAGIIIAMLRPFAVGDHIATGDSEGRVSDLDVFNTTLVTFDNETIVLPNADIVGGAIINYSARDHVRAEIQLSVSVESDLDDVTTRLLAAANACERVLPEPAPEVQIVHFGETAVGIQVEVSTLPEDREDVIFDVNREISAHYSAHGWAPRRLLSVVDRTR